MSTTVAELRSLLNHLPSEMKVAVVTPEGKEIYLSNRLDIPPYKTADGAYFTTARLVTQEEQDSEEDDDFHKIYDGIVRLVELTEEIAAGEDKKYYPVIDRLDALAREVLDMHYPKEGG